MGIHPHVTDRNKYSSELTRARPLPSHAAMQIRHGRKGCVRYRYLNNDGATGQMIVITSLGAKRGEVEVLD